MQHKDNPQFDTMEGKKQRIKEQEDRACTVCGAKNTELNTLSKNYIICESEDESLIVLCNECHAMHLRLRMTSTAEAKALYASLSKNELGRELTVSVYLNRMFRAYMAEFIRRDKAFGGDCDLKMSANKTLRKMFEILVKPIIEDTCSGIAEYQKNKHIFRRNFGMVGINDGLARLRHSKFIRLYHKGLSVAEIARTTKQKYATVNKWLKRYHAK